VGWGWDVGCSCGSVGCSGGSVGCSGGSVGCSGGSVGCRGFRRDGKQLSFFFAFDVFNYCKNKQL